MVSIVGIVSVVLSVFEGVSSLESDFVERVYSALFFFFWSSISASIASFKLEV